MFLEGRARRIELEDVKPECFQHLLDLWCGRDGVEFDCMFQLMQTARLADRFQVGDLQAVLEDSLVDHLTAETCAEMLAKSRDLQLPRAKKASKQFMFEHFEDVAATDGFLRWEAEAVGFLLDDERLEVVPEERLFECVVRWIAHQRHGGDGDLSRSGQELLGKVRFPLMEEGYLTRVVMDKVPKANQEWVRGAVEEALRSKMLLGPTAAKARVGNFFRLCIYIFEICRIFSLLLTKCTDQTPPALYIKLSFRT